MTRDEEIEKLALELTLHDLKTVDQAWPTKQEHADHRWDQNMRAAELLFTARDRWRAARQPAPKPAEPTREQRLVRFALDAKALGLNPWVSGHENGMLHLDHPTLDQFQAAAVRAALGET